MQIIYFPFKKVIIGPQIFLYSSNLSLKTYLIFSRWRVSVSIVIQWLKDEFFPLPVLQNQFLGTEENIRQ